MSGSLAVLWTVSSASPPRPWRHCSRCGETQPFASSGRFRVNANGRRLDAWLIYRCTACERTWNRPVLDRHPMGRLTPDLWLAFETNDAAAAARIAFDLADLERHAKRIERGEGITLLRQPIGLAPPLPDRLDLRIVATEAVGTRLDRVLALGLRLPRARVGQLCEAGRLSFATPGARPLGRTVPERLAVTLLLDGLPDGAAIAAAACGPTAEDPEP